MHWRRRDHCTELQLQVTFLWSECNECRTLMIRPDTAHQRCIRRCPGGQGEAHRDIIEHDPTDFGVGQAVARQIARFRFQYLLFSSNRSSAATEVHQHFQRHDFAYRADFELTISLSVMRRSVGVAVLLVAGTLW